MARKNKRSKKRRQQIRKRKQRQQATQRRSAPVASQQTHCHPPIHVGADRTIVADPFTVLGLPPGATPEAIQTAWRNAMLEYPPEQHPDKATTLRQARDRLLAPERFIERELGVLHVPRPEAFNLSVSTEAPEKLDALGRLLGQAALYALVEEALWGEALKKRYRRRR